MNPQRDRQLDITLARTFKIRTIAGNLSAIDVLTHFRQITHDYTTYFPGQGNGS